MAVIIELIPKKTRNRNATNKSQYVLTSTYFNDATTNNSKHICE